MPVHYSSLAAGLTATGACRKANWSPCWQQGLHVAARVAGRAEPQATGLTSVSGEAGVAHWDQAGSTSLLSPGRCLGMLEHAQR